MHAEKRIWLTNDGRLVADGDPDAAILAYGEGDEIAAEDEDKLPGGSKARKAPADKARKAAEDK